MSYSYALTWTDHLGRDSPCGGRASRCYTFKLTDPLNPSLPSMLVPDVVERCLEDPFHADPKELVVEMRVLGYEEMDVEDAVFLVVSARKDEDEQLEEVPELEEEPFSAVFFFSGKAVVIPVKSTSAYSDIFPLLRRAFFDKYRIKKMPEVEICYNGKALHGPCGLAAQSSTALTTLFELGVVCRRRISNPEPVGQS